MTDSLAKIRSAMRTDTLPDEGAVLRHLIAEADLDDAARSAIQNRGAKLVEKIRTSAGPGLMEVFLAEYGLSTEEGIALMCLAEALLRVPDADTIDALIEDKIAPSDWGKHLGHSSSSLVNASTWALMLTGKVLDDEHERGLAGTLRGAVRRLGEPVIRTAVGRAMREMGRQFVLGETVQSAMRRARAMEAKGYSYSYDMLGEAARTDADARRYQRAYSDAIAEMAEACDKGDIRMNPGISVKLSALHARYEVAQRDRVMSELAPRLAGLARQAKDAGMGLNIDAEEADRLDLSLDVIEKVLSDPRLAGWDGFGVVVQAYGPRAGHVLDWLYALAGKLDRKIMVRLVKGAYWDTEVKRAQVLGLDGFPVFSRKASTDVSYIANARKLLRMTDRIYPQFATHNAHTVAAILEMGSDRRDAFEFQRLHGMGERLHDIVLAEEKTRCRIYAPVGAHRDLLAYLVRRLLENGANSSFVNQILDPDVPASEVAADPFAAVAQYIGAPENPVIDHPSAIFGEGRVNARGWDLTDPEDLADIEAARAPWRDTVFEAAPIIAGKSKDGPAHDAMNPADPTDKVGHVTDASPEDVETALAAATPWEAGPAERAEVLRRAADLYERDFGLVFAIVAREAGKTQLDAVGELREAVDFLRYYAGQTDQPNPARGVFACISPWNFPLAIFTGQLSAALAAGNAVVAKPAEQTPLIAHAAVKLLHEAGVPRSALQFLPGDGGTVGAALTSDPRVDGVCFTGGTDTAMLINRAMAAKLDPNAPLIAETGGLNAMIVDSTALPEQAVRDILASSFQSAGQRCSALRCLYVQEDIAPTLTRMLFGAMEELSLGNPWDLSTDVGPVIDDEARSRIVEHVERARSEGRVLKEMPTPNTGNFVGPTVIRVGGIGEMGQEIFGPVLHLATFKSRDLHRVIDAINATGYGLTFGLHTRIDDRVQEIVDRIEVGNMYVNRNQIGAVVGSQPFGGEGLSGTGPKAGGPNYVPRFTARPRPSLSPDDAPPAPVDAVAAALNALAVPDTPHEVLDMPGPTGESNRLSLYPRRRILCMGPGRGAADRQAAEVRATGAVPLTVSEGGDVSGQLDPEALASLAPLDGVLWWGDAETARACREALARRDGPLIPLICEEGGASRLWMERHVCVDTTASGGNAQLLAAGGEA
ncbi:bifunctional proline dehydrogenase/L-glutamate gamma-semialdehyde dehydrogenase [Maritimibacter sp. 55A14]|uniref:bifunctional proline dehydrogenase/L-glutamate gamma-semialdehyde dehydrogenase PutA n=1 Tax=Maritimibacter sp. 55A14 TaxID=2174844 RepID=UPI000D61A46F|nr:bifunctional proline dehydrogenase/L-glutamate gamma-semialdehyde dehydrogenase PutA [Maritimibacter sp. 55A14]PWE33302.1 bifunctional proline dehydrogenase/L-glutamate gamma-semialdehyde dehydrogenase [Maritimibacter sp. 55A14]